MTLPEFLSQDADGYIHVAGHRIGLQDVVYYYNEGYSPEALQEAFATLSLALVHNVIAFYLDETDEVNAYVTACEQEAVCQRDRATGSRKGGTAATTRCQTSRGILIVPLNFVLDENQRGLLWRAIVRHNQAGLYPLDAVRVGDTPDLPLGSSDSDILRWSECEGRILVSFDKATMAGHLADHLQAGQHSPGIFTFRRGCRLTEVVAHLALVAYASDAWEWADRIEFIQY